MDAQDVLDHLNDAAANDWTVRFIDGDAYPVRSLHVHQELLNQHGEIDVNFRDCLQESVVEREAIAKRCERVADVWYQHGKPVGKTYHASEVHSIFDNVRNCYIFESKSP